MIKGKKKFIALGVVVVVLVMIAFRIAQVFYWPHGPAPALVISRETTFLTEPLNPDGTVNYLKAINDRYGKGVTPENNAAVLIVRAVGPGAMLPPQTCDRALALMGAAPLPVDDEYFVMLDDYAVEQLLTVEEKQRHQEARAHAARAWGRLTRGSGRWSSGTTPPADPVEKYVDRYAKAQTSPWVAADYPGLAAWLKANEKPFSLLKQASRRSKCFIPYVSPDSPPQYFGATIFYASLLQEAMRALGARAMLRTGSGDIEGAHRDLMTLQRLGRLLGKDSRLLQSLLGLSKATTGARGHSQLAGSLALTGEQARRFHADLAALPPMPGLADSLDWAERFLVLDAVMSLVRAGGNTQQLLGSSGPKRIGNSVIDFNVPLRELNRWFDRPVAAMRLKTFRERSLAFRTLGSDMASYDDEATERSDGRNFATIPLRGFFYGRDYLDRELTTVMSDCLLGVLLVTFSGVSEGYECDTMVLELAEHSMALAAFRAERGEYPGTLADLVPEYIPAVPVDTFVDRPLVYRREGQGCVLYSVGPNMTDDGGKGGDQGDAGDDLVVRLGGTRSRESGTQPVKRGQ